MMLLSEVLLPILGVVTALFVLVALKAMKVTSVHEEHAKETAKNFSYTQVALSNLGGDLKDVKGVITEAIAPRMDEVYKRVLQRGIELNGDHLVQLLAEIGLEKHLALSEDKTAILTGIDADGLKVPFVLKWDDNTKDLLIQTFAFSTTEIALPTAMLLLNFNSLLKTGTLWVKQYTSKNVIGIDYTFHLPSRHIERESLNKAISRIVGYYDDLKKILASQQIAIEEILPSEYFKLEETPHQDILALLKPKPEEPLSTGAEG